MPKLTINEMHEMNWSEINDYWSACECVAWNPDPRRVYESTSIVLEQAQKQIYQNYVWLI
jgi:hypothetical protein